MIKLDSEGSQQTILYLKTYVDTLHSLCAVDIFVGHDICLISPECTERYYLSKTRSDGEVPVVPAGERNGGGGAGGTGYHHHPATASPTATVAAAAAAATAAAGGWPPGLSLELDPVAAAWGRKLYPGSGSSRVAGPGLMFGLHHPAHHPQDAAAAAAAAAAGLHHHHQPRGPSLKEEPMPSARSWMQTAVADQNG
ncbi:unnamed protein product [Acanthoscelides obtectus]|uniref:Uncharacterized protein n=1 Tax=Acanthoscelides obtectus TaxID=200917 RepID=A0A9P0LA92_ACAOB|nr:unnamed protein product [Acanthoscelides obtectus]CAK1632921.1 hypothetical protein AOBTE_LOCUS7818 [Acanthoscelides obtectus]